MLFQRVLTVVIAAPFLIAAVLCPYVFVFKGVVLFCLIVSFWEFFSIVNFVSRERLFATLLGTIHVLFLLFCPEAWRWVFVENSVLLIVGAGYFCFFFRNAESITGLFQKLALLLFGWITVGSLGSLVGFLREGSLGTFWVFVLLGMTWLNDTFAYFAGSWWGRHKLAPAISPGKSIEGFLGGIVGSFIGFFLFWVLFSKPISITIGMSMAFVVSFVGPLGDLTESLLKRNFGVKDSGRFIPGHGGMLDRIDALLFNAAVVSIYASCLYSISTFNEY